MTNATRELKVQAEILHERIQARDKRYLGRLRMGGAVSARLATAGGHTRIPRRLARSGPTEADYFYFVARPDGSGRHEFSRNIAAHRQAATRYRRGVAK